jgi:rhamnosyltransferase
MSNAVNFPHITVLLATYNGRRWLPEQLDSILGQENVFVRVVALDDGSTDGTVEWLAERSADDPRVLVLPSGVPSGSAAANFYRLLSQAPVDDADYISFADQDDIWVADKLARHAAIARDGGFDGVSSNITSFDARGRQTLIRKNYPQREFDYLTESPGPGSTFLMTPRMVTLVKDVLQQDEIASTADYHDSLVYAIARARNWSWHIDSISTVYYRQHDHNVMGSNIGGSSALARLGLIRSRWHRRQAMVHAQVGIRVAPPETRDGLERMLALMTTPGIRARLRLARMSAQMRRRPRDRRIIGILIWLGVW